MTAPVHLPRRATPVRKYLLYDTTVPNFIRRRLTHNIRNFSLSRQRHFKYFVQCSSTMSESHTHTMPVAQQCLLTVRPSFHCIVWRPVSPIYVSRHTPLAPETRSQTTTFRSTHQVQPRYRCTQHSKFTAWHSRRRSLSRLGLVDHTASHITSKTRIGPVQVVPVLYRRHLANLIIRIGTSGATPT